MTLSPLLLDDAQRPINSPDAWARRAAALRERWRLYLGDIPQPAPAPAFCTLAHESLPHFTRDHIEYDVAPGVAVDAYLLRPHAPQTASVNPLRPAVVVFHQTVATHAKQAAGIDTTDPEQNQGPQLAERGYVVLAPRNYIFAPGDNIPGHARRVGEQFPGWRGMTRMLLDAVRAADLLCGLPGVDPRRIGCLGHSLGAKVALYAAAFDHRYRASVFSEGGVGIAMSNWHDPWYLGSDILGPANRDAARGLEHHQLLALAAPRAFLLLAGDSADTAASGDFIDAARPVYRLLAAPGRVGFLHHTAGHRYPPEARAAAEEFLDAHLAPSLNVAP
ncbi:MAG: dienelactone hydrolase family protein [Planctomycetota bacterium]|nr:dienelactone hydrolase family protein [Planctomycetota bacterium]